MKSVCGLFGISYAAHDSQMWRLIQEMVNNQNGE